MLAVMNDPREVIQQLVGAGFSEARIAQELKSDNAGLEIAQSTINRIKNGKQSARFEVGESLIRLRGRLLPTHAKEAVDATADRFAGPSM
jgi:hypothetical protein